MPRHRCEKRLAWWDREREQVKWGCAVCKPTTVRHDRNLYTGRKFWHQKDCYTPDGLREANYNTEVTWKKAAADNRKRMRPSEKVAMGLQ